VAVPVDEARNGGVAEVAAVAAFGRAACFQFTSTSSTRRPGFVIVVALTYAP